MGAAIFFWSNALDQGFTRDDHCGLPEAFRQADLPALAAREGTPLYVYAAPAIRQRVRALREALSGLDAGIRYAVKANGNGAVLRLLAEEGAGADIVSGGELERALRAGIAAADIVFSGVGKSDAEIALALDVGIGRFNIESRAELDAIQRIAAARGVTAVASVRINPDVDAMTHAKISTGKAENKFGVSIAEARAWFDAKAQWPDVRLDGLHMHIGSQLLSLERCARRWRAWPRSGRSWPPPGTPSPASTSVAGWACAIAKASRRRTRASMPMRSARHWPASAGASWSSRAAGWLPRPVSC